MKTTFDTPTTRHTLAFTLLVATLLTLVLTFELLAQCFGPPLGGGGNSDNDRGNRPQGGPPRDGGNNNSRPAN